MRHNPLDRRVAALERRRRPIAERPMYLLEDAGGDLWTPEFFLYDGPLPWSGKVYTWMAHPGQWDEPLEEEPANAPPPA